MNQPQSPSNFRDDEFITRATLCKVFLDISLRTFQYKRKQLLEAGFPLPDARMGGRKYNVGKIRRWITAEPLTQHQAPIAPAKAEINNTAQSLLNQF